MKKTVLAAGTLCWRRTPNAHAAGSAADIELLLIHRTKQRDVSFPKGKLDPGETMPQAAVRETLEETGLKVSLGVFVDTVRYALQSGNAKEVQYWAAEVTPRAEEASRFRPNKEVCALEWVPLQGVRERLSYDDDRVLFDAFLRLVDDEALDTFSVTLLRHAKAAKRSTGFPVDALRPLTRSGATVARSLVPSLRAYAPGRLYTSSALRCVDTVAPLAHKLKKQLRITDAVSQDTWESGDLRELRALARKIHARQKNVLVCSHRPVLPDLARELISAAGGVSSEAVSLASKLPPAGFQVYHFSRTRPERGLLAAETHPLDH